MIFLLSVLLGIGVLLLLFNFAYEVKMNRRKMSNDEITNVTLSCSKFCFNQRDVK